MTTANPSPTLNCPNPLCQAPNPETNSHCDRCNNYLPKRYLWAVGLDGTQHKRGDLLDNRYIFKEQQILLDSKPSFLPDFPKEIYDPAFPYLALLAYRLQVPQPYGLLNGEILLLESAPIYPAGATNTENQRLEGHLMTLLKDIWSEDSLLQQLNYFYQIVQLWIGASALKVERSLIQPNNIFAGNGFIRLLEIYENPQESLPLVELGHFWLYRSGFSNIPAFWENLWTQMIQGKINNPDELLTLLDHAIAQEETNIPFQAKIATLTDQGPSRTGNEDACYPKARHPVTYRGELSTWTTVCDGVGGHDGGELASNLAIQQINDQIEVLNNKQYQPYRPYEIVDIIKNAISSANDAICERNDIENRQERQRMGTTTVLALLNYLNVYFAHVGDSRVYRITRSGCYQLSVDDDVASREVRQGNGFYRDLSHYPAAGSLTQALGMNRSIWLRPSIQRFTVAEDCLFLLCSDGLSDFDRIEEFWKQELVPVLDGNLDITDACQRLIEVANTRNGHDNVTVSLVHYQLNTPLDSEKSTKTTMVAPDTVHERVKTVQPIATQSSKLGLGGFLMAALFIFGVGGFFLYRALRPGVVVEQPMSTPMAKVVVPFKVGQFVRLPDAGSKAFPTGMQLRSTADLDINQPIADALTVAPGTLLKVMARQERPGQEVWLRLQVCNLPPNSTTKVGATGWQSEPLVQELETVTDLMPAQMGDCAPAPPPSQTPSVPPGAP
ncbi:MAG: serine/threonine protein phosphatase [Alkalinema sp. RU_4_3]|nr:serine/threonine protein phosphatase [Alkalinema sp. RU_4_3]